MAGFGDLPSLGPLPGRVKIHPAEPLESFLFRAGLHNEIRSAGKLASFLGLSGRLRPSDTQIGLASQVLETSPSSLERCAAWKLSDPARAGWRQWFGTALPEKLLRTRHRRFTRSVGELGYHPGLWMIAAASFCPLTFEKLWLACPACAGELKWTTAHEIGECPQCGTTFSDHDAETLHCSVRHSYACAFQLVDPDSSKRRSALKGLPSAFSEIEAGEAFCTLMSLAGALRGLARAKAGAEKPFKDARRYDAPEAEDIAQAYDLLLRWPTSLHELFADFQTTVGSPRYRGGLHDLVNYLRANTKSSRLNELIEPELPNALQKTGVAYYAPKKSAVLSAARRGLVTVSEARSEFNIDNRTLERLSPNSTCLHARSPSKGGAVLYVQSKLEKAVTAYRSSRSFDIAGAALGVPSYAIPALEAAGLLVAESNPDSILLAGSEDLVTEKSIAKLRSALRGYRGRNITSSEPISLSRLLRWNVRAEVWAAIAKSVTLEELKVRVVEPDLACPSFDRLGTAREDYLSWLKGNSSPDHSCNHIGSASKGDVALALGLNSNAVRCAITKGCLATTDGNEDRVTYSSLLEFAETWISTSVAADLIGRTPRMWFNSYEDAGLDKLELGEIGKKPFLTLFKREEVVRHHESISPSKCPLRLI